MSDDEKVVSVNTLEGLINGWRAKVSEHDFDGTPEEYAVFMEAHESCADDLETVIDEIAHTPTAAEGSSDE
jgi:hypothetical protein